MKRALFLVVILLYSLFLLGQEDVRGLFYIQNCHTATSWSVLGERSYIASTFRDDYCTRELMLKRISAGFLHNSDAFICQISHYGNFHFGEMQVGLGYGRKFGSKFSLSLSGKYLFEHAEHYPSKHSFTVCLSSAVNITPRVGLSIYLYNPIRMRYGITGREVIPMQFQLMAYYHRNSSLLGYLSIEKAVPGNLNATLGVIYQAHKNFIMQGKCSLTCCGVGIHIPLKKLFINVQADWYYRISFSTEASLYYLH